MKVSAIFGMLIGSIHPRFRLVLGILYGTCLFPTAVLLLATTNPRIDEIEAVMLFWFATASLWGMIAGGSMLLIQDAHAMRMPSIVCPLLTALLSLFAATVLLPAALFSLTRGIFPLLSAQLACAALVGVLWAQLPGRLSIAIFCAVMLLAQTPMYSSVEGTQVPPFLWGLCSLLGLLALWRWFVLQRALRDSKPDTTISWRSPVLQHLRTPPETDLRSSMPAESGPTHPVTAMRVLLGAPFAPKAWGRSLRDVGLMLGMFVLLGTILPDSRHLDLHAKFFKLLPSGPLIWLLIMPMQSGRRLRALRQQHAGELNELALLPGWGGAASARRMLFSAVLQPIAAFFLGALVLAGTIAFLLKLRTSEYLLITSVIVGVAVATATYCLRILAALPSWSRLTLWLGVIGLPLAVISFGPLNSTPPEVIFILLLSWLVFCLLQFVAARQAYDVFRTRPHPFLME